jgi:hypothetical protein
MDMERLNRLQVAQNRCIRYIYNIKKWDHVTPFYKKLELLKINDYHNLHILYLVHRILCGFATPYLIDLLSLRSATAISDRTTRAHRLALNAPHVGREVPEKSFSVKAY